MLEANSINRSLLALGKTSGLTGLTFLVPFSDLNPLLH